MRDIGYETSVIRIYPIKEKLDLSSSAKATLPALWLLFICKTDLHKIGSQNKVHSIRTQTNVPWRGFFLPCPGRQNKLMEASNNVNHIHDFPRSRPSRWVNMIPVLRWVIAVHVSSKLYTISILGWSWMWLKGGLLRQGNMKTSKVEWLTDCMPHTERVYFPNLCRPSLESNEKSFDGIIKQFLR